MRGFMQEYAFVVWCIKNNIRRVDDRHKMKEMVHVTQIFTLGIMMLFEGKLYRNLMCTVIFYSDDRGMDDVKRE